MRFSRQNLLQNIDSRLNQDFLENSNMIFGWRLVNLIEDLGELPLVTTKPPYDCDPCAKLLREEFKIVVTLDKVSR